jgi:N6-L-threonylcarbamoyladenine synthase
LYKYLSRIAEKVYFNSLEKANVNEKDIEAIAFSNAPGLAPCLIEGMKFVKKLAGRLGVPVVPVNHCVAHLEIGRLTGCKDPVLLYVSGANTQIIAYEGGKYRIFGETLDLGVGNFLDTIARYFGFGFPGGPKVQKLAESGDFVDLGYSVKGMDISVSGIQNKVRKMIESGEYRKEDLAFSVQETVFSMLVEAAERALAHTGKKELLLGGGVACNKRLQEMCNIMCKERGAKMFVPENSLLVDNGAMLAYTGEIMFKAGVKIEGKDTEKLDINPRERTDEVDVLWK